MIRALEFLLLFGMIVGGGGLGLYLVGWNIARSAGNEAAREALQRGSRIHIDSVLATYKIPRKARKALERRRAELMVEEAIKQ